MIFVVIGWVALLIILAFNLYYPSNAYMLIPISLFCFQLGMGSDELLEVIRGRRKWL